MSYLNKVIQVSSWLYQLDMPELSKEEAYFLAQPAEAELGEIKKDFVMICDKRYANNSYYPDLSSIGIEASKKSKELKRIYAIGL